jgi:hypothetical protein
LLHEQEQETNGQAGRYRRHLQMLGQALLAEHLFTSEEEAEQEEEEKDKDKDTERGRRKIRSSRDEGGRKRLLE